MVLVEVQMQLLELPIQVVVEGVLKTSLPVVRILPALVVQAL
jgi:hypothetical protein